jgi:predicted RND superfamily exporter protein
MLVVSVDRPQRDVVRYDEPQIESLVSGQITTPVRAFITGQPSIDRGEKDASLSNLRRDELIAVGILLVLLLIGLRAPIAALLVTAVGAVSVLAGFGEVALLGRVLRLDPVGVAAGTMTGLALAVGLPCWSSTASTARNSPAARCAATRPPPPLPSSRPPAGRCLPPEPP